MYECVLPLLMVLQSAAPAVQVPVIQAAVEVNRADLERYRVQLEGYRLEAEEGRRTRKLDSQTYLEAISTYKKGVTDYRQMLKSAETGAGQMASRSPTTMEPIAQRNIEAIRAAVADDVKTIRAAENPATPPGGSTVCVGGMFGLTS